MSSRRKKNQGDSNSSNRNLDGRRLRTVAEAKALAEYLALKPDMEKKEKEVRRNRWEKVVELAEKRDAEARTETQGRVDIQWMTDKEDAEERTREAVLQAMKTGTFHDNLVENFVGTSEPAFDVISTDTEDSLPKESVEKQMPSSPQLSTRSFYGFEDEDESDDNDG